MLAIQAVRAGGPEVLEATDLPVPTPGPGEVLIRHAAVGLNFIDTYHRGGLYPVPFPAVLGNEGAGTIEAVGEGVTRLAVGDRVAHAGGPLGAYAEFHVKPAAKVAKLPDALSFEYGAAALLKGMTAEFLLHRCYPVQAGETVLIHAAAGGVGSILCQWAKALGAVVIATVGSADKVAVAQGHGSDHVLIVEGDWAGKVRDLTGGAGVRVVYDGVGAATFEDGLTTLGRRGMMVTFGNASGPAPAIEPLRLTRGGSLFLTRPTLNDYTATEEEFDASAQLVFAAIASGAFKVDIGQTFPLAEARAAHEALEARRTTGATVLIA